MNSGKLFICLCVGAIFASQPVFAAPKWVSTKNSVPPIVFLDTNSVKKFDSGAVYNVRYINKDYKDVIAQIYTNLNGEAMILSVSPYEKSKKYDVYSIPNNIKFKTINKDSSIYNSVIEVQNIIQNDNVKFCSPTKCAYKNFASPAEQPYVSSSKFSSSSSESLIIDEINWGPYMKDLQRRIKMNWDPPKQDTAKRVVLLIKIAKDGRLLDCHVVQSSGTSSVDEAAMRAVFHTAPFKPLPAAYADNRVDIQFTFDYNVFGASKL